MKSKKILIIVGFILIVLLGFLPKFLHDSNLFLNQQKCNLTGYIVSEIPVGCDVNLVSYSDSYALSNNGVFVKTGSVWIRGDDFANLENIKSLNMDYFLNNFFDARLFAKPSLLYDEFGGKKAGFIVSMLRKLGYDNVYLLTDNNLIRNKQIPSLDSKSKISTNQSFSGYIGFGKYNVVMDPSQVKFTTGDLLLYVTDLAGMSGDSFYLGFKDKIIIKNVYWSLFIDQGKVKSKDDIENLLKQNDVDISKYDNIYIYNPGEFWVGGLVYLILNGYFGS